MALRIVHVIDSLKVGGLENGVVNLINGLADDFTHTVVCVSELGAFRERLRPGIEVLALGRGQRRDRWVLLRLARTLRRLRPAIVHSRNWPTIEAIPAARSAGVPLVIHAEHGREATDPEGENQRRNRVRRWLSPLVDRFVTVSLDLRRWLVERVGLPETKLVTILNGVDTHRFTDEAREAGRRALGVSEGEQVVGTVGRLDPVKDHAGLLTAFARVKAEQPGASLIVIGDGPCRKELEDLAAALRLTPGVHFLGERTDVPLLLKGMDLFVLPSIAEGISNTILEAMASGLPVVATCVGGNPEVVEDGVTGALVPPRDPATLARAIVGYLQDPYLRAVQGKAARQRAVDQFDLEQMMGAYRNLYVSLAREKRLM